MSIFLRAHDHSDRESFHLNQPSFDHRFSFMTLPVLLLLLIAAAIFLGTASATGNTVTLQKPLPFSGTMITGEAYNPYNGYLYYADYVQGQIIQVAVNSSENGYTTLVFDNTITEPMAMTADQDGNLYVTDAAGQIYEFLYAASTNSYSAKTLIASGLHNPTGITADGGQNLYVADSTANKVIFYEYNSSTQTFAAGMSIGSGWNKPTAITWNGNYVGERIYVADSNGIQYLVPTTLTTFTQSNFTSSITNVQSLAHDYYDNIYAGDTNGNVTEFIPTSSTPESILLATNLGVVGALTDWGLFAVNNSSTGITAGSSQYGTLSILIDNFGYQVTGIEAPTDFEVGVTVNFTQTETLGDPLIEEQGNLLTGQNSGEFQLEGSGDTCITGNTYTAGQSCIYLIRFYPQYPGLRYGALIPQDSTDTQIAPAAEFAGIGSVGVVAFTPGVQLLTNEMPSTAYPYGEATSIYVNSRNDVLISTNSQNSGYILAGQLYGNISEVGNFLTSTPIEAAALDSNGNMFYSDNTGNLFEYAITDTADNVSYIFSHQVTQDADGNAFSFINSIALDQSNNIYFADASPDGTKGTRKVYVSYYSGNNTWLAPIAIGGPYTRPNSVQVDIYGYVYFIDRVDNSTALGTIYQLGSNGDGTYSSAVLLGNTHPSTSQPNYATSIFVDPNENVYIADEKYVTGIGGIYKLVLNDNSSGYTEQLYWTPPFDNPIAGHLPVLLSMDSFGDMVYSSGDEYQGVDLVELDAHDAPILNFTAQQNQPAEPQTFNITNYGTYWVELAIPASGTNPFIIDYPQYFTFDNSSPNACPQATFGNSANLEYNQTCTITIDFDYQSNTPLTAPITLNTNISIVEANPTNAQYPSLSATVTPVIASASTVTLGSSVNPAFTQNTVTFVAGVVNTGAGTPTGTITFYDGTTSLGMGTLDNTGNTSLTLQSLAIGSHQITAHYSGNGFYPAATSSALAELVEDFSITVTPPAIPIVKAGGTLAIPYSLSMVAPGTTFPSAITLTATGGPDGSTYTFTPSGVAAGAGTTTGTLTINVPINYMASDVRPMKPESKLPVVPLALALLLLPMAATMRKAGKRFGRMMAIALLAIAGMTATSALIGCGANKSAPYDVTVTASSGSLSHSSTFTITVVGR
jgi:sugar lactone lactonase YvrE